MKKLLEYTYGTHIFMAIEMDDGSTQKIDVYLRDDGEHYKTSGDENPELREKIIAAYKELY